MGGSVLFDVDGVLLDSIPAYERAWRCWAADHGLDVDALRAGATGRRPADIVRRALPAQDPQWEEALGRFEEHLRREQADVSLMPGAADMLERLPKGCWALVSSASRHIAEAALARLGVEIPDGSVFAGDVERGKPDPSCYALGATWLGVSPQHVLVVEDAPAGVAAARAAGMRVVAITTTHRAADLAEADEVLSTLAAAAERVAAWVA